MARVLPVAQATASPEASAASTRSPAPRLSSRCTCGGGCPGCSPARPDGGEAEAERFAEQVAPGAPRPTRDTAPARVGPSPQALAAQGGRPLAAALRRRFEPQLGADLSQVRVHSDAQAAASARRLRADAYAYGEHIVFGSGHYRPDTTTGQHLLAHELAHTVQQRGKPRRVQGSFWSDVADGISSIGRAIGQSVEDMASAVGSALATAAGWLGDRLHDVAQWAIDLVTQLPARLLRLGQVLVQGFWGVVSFIPQAIQALARGGLRGLGSFLWQQLQAGGAWVLRLLSRAFDVVGGPEAVELLQHIISHATPLTAGERRAGQAVLGDDALRWDQVRIAEGGYLHLVFALNDQRAMTTFHTINMPTQGDHGRGNLAIVVHELAHVMQYERTGSWYIGQAIHAQATVGYAYGGVGGLRTARAEGRGFASFNREQQAQIAQDYYTRFVAPGMLFGEAYEVYQPFIAELQRGEL